MSVQKCILPTALFCSNFRLVADIRLVIYVCPSLSVWNAWLLWGRIFVKFGI